MTTTGKNKKQSNRDLILESALDEFSAHGFAGARMSTVAERAGVNSRMVYHYFGNKEGLYRAALEHILETGLEIVSRVPVIRMTVDREAMSELFTQLYNLMITQPRFVRLLVAECFDGGKRLMELKQDRPDIFEPTLEKAVELFRVVTSSVRQPDERDPFWLLGVGMLMSFIVTSYDTTTLFLGQDVNSPEKWSLAIESLLFGVFAAEEQTEEILAQADKSLTTTNNTKIS